MKLLPAASAIRVHQCPSVVKNLPRPATWLLVLSLSVLQPFSPSLRAQTQDEHTRLMQEYMARRAEWVELRRAALDKVKAAKDDKEKKQHFDKLADDEKPLLAKMGEAGRAYQAAEKAKREQLAPTPAPAPRG